MLASTVQFSSYDRAPHQAPAPSPQPWSGTTSKRGPQAKTRPPAPTGTHDRVAAPSSQPSGCSLRTQQRAKPTPTRPADLRSLPTASCRRTRSHRPSRPASRRCSTLEHHHTIVRRVRGPGQPPPPMTGKRGCQMLLRKEVIQPHLPVRLPCYDLVPIASPTFDSSLHKGWATGFGCYRLS